MDDKDVLIVIIRLLWRHGCEWRTKASHQRFHSSDSSIYFLVNRSDNVSHLFLFSSSVSLLFISVMLILMWHIKQKYVSIVEMLQQEDGRLTPVHAELGEVLRSLFQTLFTERRYPDNVRYSLFLCVSNIHFLFLCTIITPWKARGMKKH